MNSLMIIVMSMMSLDGGVSVTTTQDVPYAQCLSAKAAMESAKYRGYTKADVFCIKDPE